MSEPGDAEGNVPPTWHTAYLFEAKGIQRWVMEGGRLRHIAAASDLLARVVRSDKQDLLQSVLDQATFTPHLSRRAGGAFMLHYTADDQETFQRFRSLWRLVFMQVAPGLEFVESFGHDDASPLEALKRAFDPGTQGKPVAGRENGMASLLPLGHPLVAFAQRTGRPATLRQKDELLDSVTSAKRRAAKADQAGLVEKFRPDDWTDAALSWPTMMDVDEDEQHDETAIIFPFVGEDRWIAVMHADISGLGDFFSAVRGVADREGRPPEAALELALDAAAVIEAALTAAARAATRDVLLKGQDRSGTTTVPARPILLGGDDVTIILRGDMALPFTRCFLEALERESETGLTAFVQRHGITGDARRAIAVPLTAAAGVAFGKAKQPFFRLGELAESLCGYGKRAAKAAAKGTRPASMVAFHRVTESALASDADGLFERLRVPEGQWMLTAQPYQVGSIAAKGFASLAALDDLREAMAAPELKTGRLRELRTLLLSGQVTQAAEAWSRWNTIAAKRDKDAHGKFRKCLGTVVGGTEPVEFDLAHETPPLFDALEWEAVT